MSVLEKVIGWLAPPDCLACGAEGDSLCASCSATFIEPFGERCWRCNRLSRYSKTCESCWHAGPLSHVWIVTDYRGAAQELIQLYKFRHQRAAADSLAHIMRETFLNSSPPEIIKELIVVPVPTATSRVRERGFAHSELLAKTIAADIKMENTKALRRLGQTRQLGASREARLRQLAGNFAVINPKSLGGQKILLVDDVLTTGGTLISAAQTLKSAGAKQVNALLFAKKL